MDDFAVNQDFARYARLVARSQFCCAEVLLDFPCTLSRN